MDGKLTLNGFLRTQVGIHIAESNPNLAYMGEDNHHLSMWRNWVQLEPNYQVTDNLSVYSRLTFANENARMDDSIHSFEAFPKDYPGDLKMEDDNNMLEVAEIYADYENEAETLWVRLGKQQVSWGQSDGLRLLDVVNPLDQSWHGVNLLEPYLEAFDNLRESIWMARVTAAIPSCIEDLHDVQLEMLAIPNFVPSTLPAPGSPYHLQPFTNLGLPVDENLPEGEEWGLRLMGVYKRLEWSLNYLYHYQDEGITDLRRVLVDGTAELDHPRVNSYGFGLSYDDNLRTKAVYRVEFLYEPDAPYESGQDPFGAMFGGPVDRRTVRYLIGIDRPTFVTWLNPTRTVSFGFQFIQFHVLEDRDDLEEDMITLNGSSVKKTTTLLSFSADTGYMQDRVKPNFLFIYDERQSYYNQIGCEFRFTDNWIGYAAVSYFGGEDKNAANSDPGSLYWMDEVMLRLTYQF